MTFIVTTSGVITVGKMGRECNVVVCSFDVLGRNSMVCRGGETASITSARSVASLIAEP